MEINVTQEPCRARSNHCSNLSNEEIAAAFVKWPIFGAAAHNLGERISRAELVARVDGSQELQRVLAKAENDLLTHCKGVVAKARARRLENPCCGARTREDRTCKRPPVLGSDRCPNHGGMSTGPGTAEGKSRISAAQRKRWARHRQK